MSTTTEEQCPVYSTPQNIQAPHQWNQPRASELMLHSSALKISVVIVKSSVLFLCPQQYSTPYPVPIGVALYPTGSSSATQFSKQLSYQPTTQSVAVVASELTPRYVLLL